MHKTIAVDLALITDDAALLRDLALSMVKTAKQHEAHSPSLGSRRYPVIGTILSLVRRDDLHAIGRFPRVQDCASSARVVKGRKDSAGKRVGTSGTNLGNAHRQWACSEAAAVCLRHHPHGQKRLARVETTQGHGTALTRLAPQRARAV